jgi:hypothetical protein
MKSRWFTLLAAFGFLVNISIPSAQGQVVPAGAHRPPGVPQEYVITPSGYFHPSCVRELKKGEVLLSDARVIQHADGTLENLPPCAYPHYTSRGEKITGNKAEPPTISHAWVEYADATTTTAYGNLTGIWPVPPDPTSNDGQTLYFFTGLEDENDVVTILQPVLGWNAFSNLTAWSLASWNCCPDGDEIYSTPFAVSVGDTILGSISMTCSAGTETCSEWNVSAEDETSAKTTILKDTSNYGQTFNWAFGAVLEVYNVVQCNDYPAGNEITFSDLGLYNDELVQISNPDWAYVNNSSGLTPQCDYGGQTTSSSATIDFGNTSTPLCTATTTCSVQGTYPGQVVAGSVSLSCKEAMILTASATICGETCVTDSVAPPEATTGVGAGDATPGSGGSCNLSWSWGGNNYNQELNAE